MDLSDDLARLNVARYKAWSRAVPQQTSRQAVLERASAVAQLETFDAQGYALARGKSTADRLVFRRDASN